MTCREKLLIDHPDKVSEDFIGGCSSCPYKYGYLDRPSYCNFSGNGKLCTKCWDREIPDTSTAADRIGSIVDIETILDKLSAEWEIRYDPKDESYFIQAVIKKEDLS